jgi:BlaI family penicillinase repressor
MKTSVKISNAEWEVMNIIWNKSPITAFEIIQALSSTKWKSQTIKTMLERLLKKGALTFERQANRYLYQPLLQKRDCIREEAHSFLGRVFDGAVTPMLAHFIETEKLSEEEIKSLKKLLQSKETK